LLIDCIKAREREKGSKEWIEKREFFTDKMDLVRRELKILGRKGGM